MVEIRILWRTVATAMLAAAAAGVAPKSVRAQHMCDPVDPVADIGWAVTATEETLSTVDGIPYQIGPGRDWFIDRTATILPFCNYFNAIGIYSMRSYSLSPREKVERIAICKGSAQGTSEAVPPYSGPCPPK